MRENLEKKLLWAGVEAKRIYMTENKNGARQLIMALSAKSARCISMKLVCERIEEVLGKRMVLCANQPLLVSSVTRWVRFEEECPYFVLLALHLAVKAEMIFQETAFRAWSCQMQKVLLLCDGMGSGSVAGKESAGVTELAESLCEAGYSPSLLIRVINSALMIQAKEHPVTIDLTVIDCANGICELTKSGAAVTFKARHTDDAGWCRQYAGRNIAGARTDGKNTSSKGWRYYYYG